MVPLALSYPSLTPVERVLATPHQRTDSELLQTQLFPKFATEAVR